MRLSAIDAPIDAVKCKAGAGCDAHALYTWRDYQSAIVLIGIGRKACFVYQCALLITDIFVNFRLTVY